MASGKPLTDAEKRQVQKLAAQGLAKVVIVARTGLSRPTIDKCLKHVSAK